MGSSVSRPTGRTSFSVISANASAALRWRSTLSENERVVNAARGEPAKKLVVVRSARATRQLPRAIPVATTRRTLKELEEVGDSLALVLEEERLVCCGLAGRDCASPGIHALVPFLRRIYIHACTHSRTRNS
jgi:hypothetical protein